ncbi:hypothetical protein GW17_00025198 [Ensete ventricosum]|uniref:Uncharacterized protein n=1 Tax=Ensete ventricosum TaxID=4639 RepID=A0A444ELD0_ENSVE|nr:hypothetical protein B296_00032671 [Ensete ventricosum]RWW11217.1 hypothetical protein GW17_00025198 [Ensete ventricosum]
MSGIVIDRAVAINYRAIAVYVGDRHRPSRTLLRNATRLRTALGGPLSRTFCGFLPGNRRTCCPTRNRRASRLVRPFGRYRHRRCASLRRIVDTVSSRF